MRPLPPIIAVCLALAAFLAVGPAAAGDRPPACTITGTAGGDTLNGTADDDITAASGATT